MGACSRYVGWCRPSANVERRVRIHLTALFPSKLKQTSQIGQAAILGQMTTGFPVSPLTPATFLLVGLTGVELGEHQKFSIPYLFGISVVMTMAAVLFRIFPF